MNKKNNKKSDDLIRLNRYIAASGFCSRREADQLIADERITVNGQTATMGTEVTLADRVCIDGEVIRKEHLILDPAQRRTGKVKTEPGVSQINKEESAKRVVKERIQRNASVLKADRKSPGGRQMRSVWKKGLKQLAEEEEKTPKKFYYHNTPKSAKTPRTPRKK